MTVDEETTANPRWDVEQATARVLELARSWIDWDGRPRLADDGARIFTPHKAIRRYLDHLVDHLAQMEALLAGVPTRPNGWRESAITTGADFARFTEADLGEATERLTRLSRTFRLRLLGLDPGEWDLPRGDEWTLREIAVPRGGEPQALSRSTPARRHDVGLARPATQPRSLRTLCGLGGSRLLPAWAIASTHTLKRNSTTSPSAMT